MNKWINEYRLTVSIIAEDVELEVSLSIKSK